MPIRGFARELLPYHLSRKSDGRWTLLNRDYKTITFVGAAEDNSFKLLGMSPAKLAKISWNGEVAEDGVFLYNDGTHPMTNARMRDDYLLRLGLLIAASKED